MTNSIPWGANCPKPPAQGRGCDAWVINPESGKLKQCENEAVTRLTYRAVSGDYHTVKRCEGCRRWLVNHAPGIVVLADEPMEVACQ